MQRQRHRKLLRRCAAAAAELGIPTPFNLDRFCQQLEQRRGRPIHRIPIAAPPGSPCGMWIALRGADYIFYEAGTTPLHTEHIVLHETGHMVLAHRGTSVWDGELTQRLTPHLHPQLVQHALGRAAYSAREEQEAEIFASLICERVHRPAPQAEPRVSPESGDALHRVERTFGG